jgi:hypothetical protein
MSFACMKNVLSLFVCIQACNVCSRLIWSDTVVCNSNRIADVGVVCALTAQFGGEEEKPDL